MDTTEHFETLKFKDEATSERAPIFHCNNIYTYLNSRGIHGSLSSGHYIFSLTIFERLGAQTSNLQGLINTQ
jgi:hypothetical protein